MALSLIEFELGFDFDATDGTASRESTKSSSDGRPSRINRTIKLGGQGSCFCQRRSDLVKMKCSECDGKYIKVQQQKAGALLSIVFHKKLRAS